ncbi:MAG: PepSY domain-containing protein [Sphingomicrobium sp.]
MGAVRSRLRRWHVWLGWIVGIPILLWVVSGVVMVWRPIEEVRGEHLVTPLQPVRLSSAPVPPRIEGVPLSGLSLKQTAAGPRWVVEVANGPTRLADPATGALLPPVSATDAAREVAAVYTGQSSIRSVSRTDPDNPPLELRRPIPAWKVSFADGTNFYVHAGSGEIVARRTPWWRLFDLMWGIHIMDLETREDMHNPLVLGFGIASVAMGLLALALLPMTIRRRRRAVRQDQADRRQKLDQRDRR